MSWLRVVPDLCGARIRVGPMSLGWARLASGVEPGGTLHRQLPRTRACTLLAAVALAAVACSSSDAERPAAPAPSRWSCSLWPTTSKPGAAPVLDRGGPAARWRVAASRSPITGAIRSRLRQGHHRRGPGRRGQLAKVAARAYDTVGIDSFQALLELLLIDNQMLERRGPEETWRARCWWGSASLAWLGWRCCPPTCAAAGSVASAGGVQDYRAPASAFGKARSPRRSSPLGATPSGIAQADRSGGSTEPNSI